MNCNCLLIVSSISRQFIKTVGYILRHVAELRHNGPERSHDWGNFSDCLPHIVQVQVPVKGSMKLTGKTGTQKAFKCPAFPSMF